MRNLIRGVARPLLRPLGRGERGVVGVLVALLLGGGVLMGLGALVIDVGQLYQNRAELQNGADAGALAVAKSCVTGACTPTLAAQYANENASALTGGKAAVSRVCGSGILGACPASTGALTDCPAAPASGAGYVDVHTSTQLSGGSTVLPASFAKALLGNSSYTGSTVQACSQVAWGGPSSATTVSFAISACEWDQATSLGTVFAQPPPYPPHTLPSSTLDRVLKQRSGAGAGCASEAAGADAPGQFGWSKDPSSICSLLVNTGTFGGNPGAAVSNACKTVLAADVASRALIYLPIYTSISGVGANSVYALKGFAAFVLTGYHLTGVSSSDWLKPSNDCTGSNKCINGYFTQGIVPSTGALSSTTLGVTIIELTG